MESDISVFGVQLKEVFIRSFPRTSQQPVTLCWFPFLLLGLIDAFLFIKLLSIIGKPPLFVKKEALHFRRKVPVYRTLKTQSALERSFITSPARINPATEGTKAMLPGAIRPAVPFFSLSMRFPSSSYSLDGTGSSLE